VLVTGATDVGLRVTKGLEVLPEVLDLSGIAELRHVSTTPDGVVIGAAVPLEELLGRAGDAHPALVEMIRWFGSGQIRNLATLGGNLGTASPIGDTLPVLVAAGARVRVAGVRGSRELPIESFLLGYRRTALAPDELIVAVVLPRVAANEVQRAYKVSKRREMDISTVSAAFRIVRDGDTVLDPVLAYGGMADTVKRATRAEAFLHGKPWTRETVEEAMTRVDHDFTPIADARGGADMRRIAARNLLLKFWSDTAGEGARMASEAAR
jgi:xanthine dehydrogenase small subunit